MIEIKNIQGKRKPRRINLKGVRFGRLVVLEECGKNKYNRIMWKCLCDCGNVVTRSSATLLSGDCRSCGCYGKEQRLKSNTKHGQSRSRLYHCWQGIKSRCYNKNNPEFHRYGGRGISMCNDWVTSYDSFSKWALDNGYKNSLTIDRKDFDKGYSPENCRWITIEENAKNTSICIIIEINGIKDTIRGWSYRLNVCESTLRRKYNQVGENAIKDLIECCLKTGNKKVFSKLWI